MMHSSLSSPDGWAMTRAHMWDSATRSDALPLAAAIAQLFVERFDPAGPLDTETLVRRCTLLKQRVAEDLEQEASAGCCCPQGHAECRAGGAAHQPLSRRPLCIVDPNVTRSLPPPLCRSTSQPLCAGMAGEAGAEKLGRRAMGEQNRRCIFNSICGCGNQMGTFYKRAESLFCSTPCALRAPVCVG